MENLRKVIISDTLNTEFRGPSYIAYDLFKATCNPRALKEAAQHLSSVFPADANCIISPGLGALALSSAISVALLDRGREVPVLVVRDPKKSRPEERLVQGVFPKDPKGVFVDDTIVVGATLDKTLATVREIRPDFELAGIQVLLDSRHLHGSRKIIASGIPFSYCFTRQSLGITTDDSSISKGGVRIPALKVSSTSVVSLPELNFSKQTSVPAWTGDGFLLGDRNHKLVKADEKGVVWQVEFKPGSKGICQDFLLVGSTVILGEYSGTISRVEISTGKVLWSHKISNAIHATPILDGETLYIVIEDFDLVEKKEIGAFVALDLDGNIKYRVNFSSSFAPATPGMSEGVLVVASNDCILRGFRGQDEIWTVQLENKIWGKIEAKGGFVYCADNSGWVYKVNLQDGALIWKNKISKSFVLAVPTLFNEILILSDSNLYTHGINVNTGKRIWITKTRSQVAWRLTRYGEGRGILLGKDGDCSVIDLITGEKIAETRIPLEQEEVIHQPGCIHQGALTFITSLSNLYTIEMNTL